MVNKKISSHIKSVGLGMVVLCAIGCMLLLPVSCAKGVRQGMAFSIETLIPSLFPFLVLSSFIVKSSLASRIGFFFDKATRFLFKLPGCAGVTILVGLIGGYPVGARGVNELVNQGQITKGQGERMLFFIVGAGPVFVISVVGSGLLGSKVTGLIMFLSQIIASIVIGVGSGLFSKEEVRIAPCKMIREQQSNISKAFINACADATTTMINMCSLVVLFSAILVMFNESGFGGFFVTFFSKCGMPKDIANAFIPIALEVTGGCAIAAKQGVAPEIISFALGWAGKCVHFQISALLEDVPFSWIRFSFFRIMHGIISAFLTHIGFLIFPEARLVYKGFSEVKGVSSQLNVVGSMALIILCVCFLFSISREHNLPNDHGLK